MGNDALGGGFGLVCEGGSAVLDLVDDVVFGVRSGEGFGVVVLV